MAWGTCARCGHTGNVHPLQARDPQRQRARTEPLCLPCRAMMRKYLLGRGYTQVKVPTQ